MKQWIDYDDTKLVKERIRADPRVILEPSDVAKNSESLFSKHWIQSFTACLGLGTAFGHNYSNRRPLYSGAQKHIAGIVIGYAIGELMYRHLRKQSARKDAILRDYIRQHPEDFPIPEPIKFKHIFQEWNPNR